jgi:hypothetical protein
MGILGIYASQISGHLNTNSYESIATATGSGSTINFTSIPQTYKHLQLRFMAFTNRGTYGIDGLVITFKGDTGMNYSQHTFNGNGASVAASGQGSGSIAGCYMDFVLGTTVSNFPGVGIIDLLDYTNTNKYKTMRGLGGTDLNGTVGGVPGRVNFASSLWLDTRAIDSITLTPVNGTFTTNTHVGLYGIKG